MNNHALSCDEIVKAEVDKGKSKHEENGYERFSYHVRGHVKNLKLSGDKTMFNIVPIPMHASTTIIDGKDSRSSITLIGTRLVKSVREMVIEGDVITIPEETTFISFDAPHSKRDGDYCEVVIDELEARKVRSQIQNPNPTVHVSGVL